jgi:hypothetical protein
LAEQAIIDFADDIQAGDILNPIKTIDQAMEFLGDVGLIVEFEEKFI